MYFLTKIPYPKGRSCLRFPQQVIISHLKVTSRSLEQLPHILTLKNCFFLLRPTGASAVVVIVPSSLFPPGYPSPSFSLGLPGHLLSVSLSGWPVGTYSEQKWSLIRPTPSPYPARRLLLLSCQPSTCRIPSTTFLCRTRLQGQLIVWLYQENVQGRHLVRC